MIPRQNPLYLGDVLATDGSLGHAIGVAVRSISPLPTHLRGAALFMAGRGLIREAFACVAAVWRMREEKCYRTAPSQDPQDIARQNAYIRKPIH